MLSDYQSRFIDAVRDLVGANWLRRRPRLRILDSGCDPSGRQLRALAELTRGEVVGINPAPGFPSEEARARAGARVRLLSMDGCALAFPDASFDLVLSANVMEHVPDPGAYLRECARVLKPGGLAYVESAPIWTGPRGHHIHEDMVARAVPTERDYRNDGSVIPDWSHLRLDEGGMRAVIAPQLLPETVDYILDYLYRSEDLNHWGWRRMELELRRAFPRFLQLSTWPAGGEDQERCPDDEGDDYEVHGFRAVCRLAPPHPLIRRLAWRLRRLGL